MSRKDDYESKSWELLKEVLADTDMRPVDAEFVKEGQEYYLRFYIDRDGGVTIDDCESVSRALDPRLDEEDFISEAYTMEVSSPGLGRVLKRPHDFEFAMGREVEIKTFRPVNGKKELTGILKDWSKDSLTIETEEGETVLERSLISRARLAFDF